MRLFRFLAYCFALLLGIVFAFRGTNTFPAQPPKQYQPPVYKVAVTDAPPEVSDAMSLAVSQGKTLFTNNCATCHNRNMKDHLTGPALGGVMARWMEYPKQDLYEWIRNSRVMIDSGHPRAVALWKEWAPTTMTAFPNLSDEQIDNLLAYVDAVYAS